VLLSPSFSAESINPQNNTNWPMLDVPEINKAIEDARLIDDPEERAKAWAEVDRLVSAQAPAVPWDWENFPIIRSADVVGVANPYNSGWDLAFTSLK